MVLKVMSNNDMNSLGSVFSKIQKSDPWFHNFTELEFLIDEITGDNADDYIYTWGSVIKSLDKPTPIKIGSNRAGFKSVSDMVRDYLSNHDIYDKYMDQWDTRPISGNF